MRAQRPPRDITAPAGSAGAIDTPFITIVARSRSADPLNGATRFFRGAEAFESLGCDVFAPLAQRTASMPLRVWVPGCSTGEEAYSIAMAYSEFCASTGCDVPLRLVGTDVDGRRIEAARRAVYGEAEMKDVSAARRERFFSNIGTGWRVDDVIRQCCAFLQHDVIEAPALSGADFVAFRNVLVYLRRETRREVLAKLHAALQADGVLWLGAEETAVDAPKLFEVRNAATRIYVKVTPGRRIG